MTIKGTEGQDKIIQSNKSPVLFKCIGLVMLLLVAVALSFTKISDWYSQIISFEENQLLTAQVFRGDLIQDVTVSGRLIASKSEQIYNDEAGEVTFHVAPGEQIKKGQVIATIDNKELPGLIQQHNAELTQLKIQVKRGELADQEMLLTLQRQLDKVQITLNAAKREKKRLQKLFTKGQISALALEKAEDKLLEANLAFIFAQKKATLIHKRLTFEQENREIVVTQQSQFLAELLRRQESLQIKSPITGIVGNWQVKQKEQLTALSPLLVIIDQSYYEAQLSVPEFSGEKLRIGQLVHLSATGKQLDGVIQSISPQIINNHIQVKVTINSPENLTFKMQQRVNGTIELSRKNNILMVKRGAFINSGYAREVFKVIDDLAIKSPITLGIKSTQFVEVVSGAKENDQLIISDYSDFQMHSTIRLIK